MSRRVLLLLVLLAAPALAQSPRPAVVILDASFSMSLSVDGGRTRLELLTQALEDELRETAAAGTARSFALVVFEDEDEFSVKVPYPASAEAVVQAARRVEPWGTSPIGPALQFALLYARTIPGSGAGVDLLVVTDGQDHSSYLGTAPPLPDHLLARNITVSAITLGGSGAGQSGALESWVARGGGRLITVTNGGPSQRAPSPGASPQTQHELSSPDDVQGPAPTDLELVRWAAVRALSAWLVVARWNFLASVLLGAVAIALAILRHRQRVRATVRHNAEPAQLILESRSSSGRQKFTLSRFPASVGTASRCSAYLGKAASGKRGSFTLTLENGGVLFSSAEKLNVNGVPRREWRVTQGDQIRIDRYRVEIAELIAPEEMPMPPVPFVRTVPVPLFALVAVVLLFALRPFGGQIVMEAPAATTRAPVLEPDPLPVAAQALRASDAALAAPARPNGTTPEPPAVIAPGEPPRFFDADYLAIHAHPDDESLDFGVLLSRLDAAGLNGVVVLLTDGQSGRDQYPRREVGGLYAAYDMTGGQLIRARVSETRAAMTHLGVDRYVRLGLPNHPYNSLSDTLAPGDVIERWGGIGSLTATISRLLEGFQPEILISPDGPSGAYEHFEHEATGIAVRTALQELQRAGRSPVRAHVTSVDPLQTAAYGRVLQISPWETDPRTGSTYRAAQLRALLEHRTQRDASVVGVETRLAVPAEYYAVSYWDAAFDPPRALGLSESGTELSAMARP